MPIPIRHRHWGSLRNSRYPLTTQPQGESTEISQEHEFYELDNVSGFIVPIVVPTGQVRISLFSPIISLCPAPLSRGTASMMIDHFPFCNHFVEIESIYIVFELVSESLKYLALQLFPSTLRIVANCLIRFRSNNFKCANTIRESCLILYLVSATTFKLE